MARYRTALPQLAGDLFLTDGGIETTLIHHEGIPLPDFAAFVLLDDARGEAALARYYHAYVDVAARFGTGLVLETATWRASADWGARLGYDARALARTNARAVALLHRVREARRDVPAPIVVSGCVGPRGDGYVVGTPMSVAEAERYHQPQLEALARANADMACALTMTHVEEAVGVARAARRAGLPAAVSFTVETDGTLPSGEPLASAIARVDAATGAYPCYYMVNCAHPTHLAPALDAAGAWVMRVRGLRANASRLSHAALNEATALDTGDPDALGDEYATLTEQLPNLSVMGGCCGTDHRHVERIAAACLPLFRPVG